MVETLRPHSHSHACACVCMCMCMYVLVPVCLSVCEGVQGRYANVYGSNNYHLPGILFISNLISILYSPGNVTSYFILYRASFSSMYSIRARDAPLITTSKSPKPACRASNENTLGWSHKPVDNPKKMKIIWN